MASSKAVPLRMLFPTLLVACFANRKSFQARTKNGQCSKNIFSQQIKNQMLWFWRDGYFKAEISHTGIGLITIKLSPLYSLPLGPMTFWLMEQKLYFAGNNGNESTRCKALKLLDSLCSKHSLNPLLLMESSLSTWQISLNLSMENIYKQDLHFWNFRDGYLYWWVSYTWKMMRLLLRGLALAERDNSKNI